MIACELSESVGMFDPAIQVSIDLAVDTKPSKLKAFLLDPTDNTVLRTVWEETIA